MNQAAAMRRGSRTRGSPMKRVDEIGWKGVERRHAGLQDMKEIGVRHPLNRARWIDCSQAIWRVACSRSALIAIGFVVAVALGAVGAEILTFRDTSCWNASH
ncbi:hypothetical protein [Burkholderia ubonensis]|uniref:hypothetical protein n=1 Tax=Burkholderia ubonensis TaxID=101571 RepID=UPI00116048D7|nr:hypothetical protein [Burkholderia ubonensis]